MERLQELLEAVHRTALETVDDVIRTMEDIRELLPNRDGLARFNYLYLETTRGVKAALHQGGFASPPFVERLDVEFAKLYFDAVRAATIPDHLAVPRVWRVLLASRDKGDRIHPLQFALAGMNAHINRDLPAALVGIWEALGLDPEAAVAERRDFEAVNRVLEQTAQRIKAEFESENLAKVDRALGSLDDSLALFSIAAARQVAWDNGRVLRVLPGLLRRDYLEQLDRGFGLVGRLLLVEHGPRWS